MKAGSMNVNILNECFGFNSKKTSRIISRYYDKKISESGVRYSQFLMLVCYMNNINNENENENGSIVDKYGVDRTTFYRNNLLLLKKGLIEIFNPISKKYVITIKGREYIENVFPLWKEAQEEIMHLVGEEFHASYISSMNLLSNLAKMLFVKNFKDIN